MKSPPSSFRKLRETDAIRNLSKDELLSTTIGISLHSKDTIIFEDNTCSNGSFGEDLTVGSVGKPNNQTARADNDDAGQLVLEQPPPARPVLSSLQQGQRKAPRRKASSEKDQGWFTLSATTVRELSSVASSTKKRQMMPKSAPMSTMTATEKLAREKQATLEDDLLRVKLTDENNNSATEKEQRDENVIAAVAPARSDSRRSSKPRLSKIEIEAREREKALILKLWNSDSTSTTNTTSTTSTRPTIHKTSQDRSSHQEEVKNRAAIIMTPNEAEARRMAELLERKLRDMGCRDADAKTSRKGGVVFQAGDVPKTVSGKMKHAKRSLKISTPTSQDDSESHKPLSDDQKTSPNARGMLKAGLGHDDAMNRSSSSKPERSPETPTPSDGTSCEHDSETNDRKVIKDQPEQSVSCETQSDDDEESIRALHRKMENIGMAHTIVANREEEVSVYSFTEDLKGSHRQKTNRSYAKRKESACPQLQFRDDEANRGGGLSSGENHDRENPNDRNDTQKHQVRDSTVDKAIQRYKAAVAAGTPATESFFLRCLEDVKEEHGDPNCTEERQNKMLPKDIAFVDDISSRTNNRKNNKRTKDSPCIENGSQDSNEHYTGNNKSSERGVRELGKFPDAAPMANGQKLNSAKTKRRSRTRFNGEESTTSNKIGVSRNGPDQDSQTEQQSEEFSERDVLEKATFPDAAPLASGQKLNSIMKKRGSRTRSNGDESTLSKKSDFSPVRRVRFVAPKPAASSFPEAAPLDLESGVTDSDDSQNSTETPDIDKLATQGYEKFVESAQSEGRMSYRTTLAISIILCAAFLIILFVVLDPLRRLTSK